MYINNRFIISSVFILLCGFFLITTDSIAVVVPPQSNCCIASGGMGCDNQACEITICDTNDNGMCCGEAWDQTCANLANQLCDVCTIQPQGCCTGLGVFPDNCDELTQEECTQQGGVYQGDDTSCNQINACFQPTLLPLEATNELFTDHTVTATFLLAGSPQQGVLIEFEVISGPNMGEGSDPNSGECTPNNNCTTDVNGQVSWTYSSGLVGTDTIIASVDGTASNTVMKQWIVPRGCCTDLGEFPDNCTVLTELQCIDQGGDYLGDDTSCNEVLSCFQPTLEPLDATNEVFTEHTVNATYHLAGVPEEGVLVEFEIISGPNEGTVSEPGISVSTANEQVSVRSSVACTPNADCTTDANGQVSWTYTSSLLGIDTIIASVDGTASNRVENEWILIRNIPTLSVWGLIIIAGLLAIAGIVMLKRKKIVFRA